MRLTKSRPTACSFNVKLLGVPELATHETALQTTMLGIKIFNKMGAEVSTHNIDTAHRVKPRNASNRPKPIICKFIRQLTREEVMSKRTEISQVAPQDVGLPGTSSLTNAMVVDHLT